MWAVHGIETPPCPSVPEGGGPWAEQLATNEAMTHEKINLILKGVRNYEG